MKIDLSNYTFSTKTPRTVPVAEFRDQIDHLFDVVNRDYHACGRRADELERWARTARAVGAELCAMTCQRATQRDWDRRERAIERSATLLQAMADNTPAAAMPL